MKFYERCLYRISESQRYFRLCHQVPSLNLFVLGSHAQNLRFNYERRLEVGIDEPTIEKQFCFG